MRLARYLILLGALPLAVQVGAAQPKDAEGCKDSPLISRFPGSVLTGCKDKDDDAFDFEMGGGKPKKRIEVSLMTSSALTMPLNVVDSRTPITLSVHKPAISKNTDQKWIHGCNCNCKTGTSWPK